MISYSPLGFVLASGLVLLICWIVYSVVLERKSKPSVLRKAVIGIYGLMLLVPVVAASVPFAESDDFIEIGLPTVLFGIENQEYSDSEMITRIDISSLLLVIYLTGVVVMLMTTALSLAQLLRLQRNSNKKIINGRTVYVHSNSKIASFSWGENIFVHDRSLDQNHDDIELMLLHEEAHVRSCHWLDLIMARLTLIFQWYNPAAWMLGKELQIIHEYEADAMVLGRGIEETSYQMLLIKNISRNRFSGLTDGLNNCSLKKRILMMKKTRFKSSGIRCMSALILVAGFAGMVLHSETVASILASPEKGTETMILPVNNTEDVNYTIDPIVVVGYNYSDSETPRESKDPVMVKVKVTETVDFDVNVNEPTLGTGKAQTDVQKVQGTSGLEICMEPETLPVYEGGLAELMKFMAMNVRYPESALKDNIQGEVIAEFIVTKEGKVTDVKIKQGVTPELDEEALRVIKMIPDKWTPGKFNGENVNVLFSLPIKFKLSRTTKMEKAS